MARCQGKDDEPALVYTLSIQPEAEAEILEVHRWYEDQAPGLGAEFSRALDACLAAVERNPSAYAVIHGEVRRALLRRFPYGVFYMLDESRIVILALLHGHRDPSNWPRGRRR